ncbi:MAG: TRAP transporter small permease [Notoacmeibacter sp.]|nr:TRAP transporter small permease [Notoacmeibacter sp.]
MLGAYVTLPVLIAMIGVDVFLRYVLRAPLPWGNEVGSLMLLVAFMASLPYCTHLGGHARMDLFYGRYGERAKRLADAVSASCGLVLAAVLAYQSFSEVGRMYRLGSGAYLIELPYWPFAVLMGFSASVLCLQFLAAIGQGLASNRTGKGK